MTDIVFIERLIVETVIGDYDWEREVEQRLEIDLEMKWNNRMPGLSDNVGDALDYAAVSDAVQRWFAEHQPRLLEKAAEAIAAMIQNEFEVEWLRLTLRKPGAVPGACNVGVRIERGI